MKLSEQNYMVPRLDEIPIRNVPSPDVVTKKGRRDVVFSREPTHPYGPAIDRTSGMPAMIHLAGRVYGSSVEEYVVGDHVQCTLDSWLDGGRFGSSRRKQETRIRVSGTDIGDIEIVTSDGTFRYEVLEESVTHCVIIINVSSPTDRGVSDVVFAAVRLFFLFIIDQYF